MAFYYYNIAFILSFTLSVYYVFRWKKHFDVNITALFLLIPLVDLGYVNMLGAENPEQAYLANKLIYLGGCYLVYFITFCVFSLCRIAVPAWLRTVLFLYNSVIYAFVLTIGEVPYFYKSAVLHTENGMSWLEKEYGPVHTLFYISLCLYLLAGFGAIVYTIFKKNQVSKKTVFLLFLPEFFAIGGFFGGRLFSSKVDMLPLSFVLAQIVYLLIVERISLYRTSDMVIETIVEKGENGFITIENHEGSSRYLGSNSTAREILPELNELYVDQKIDGKENLEKTVLHWLKLFKEDGKKYHSNLYVRKTDDNEDNDRMYSVRIDEIRNGIRKVGYQIILDDDTADQKYIRLLDKYNTELEEEVEKKTRRVVEMHDNLILSMATMVESRDNSTGGHIRRTSEGVRILIEEIVKDNKLSLTEEFCKDIIKAAPMHDLGKIAVDDAVLRNPNRFTPEEFEIMKKHAPEGARIVHEILKDTDDESFKVVAENVAHYHHERWDGSGYPEGLKGEEIPIEARIMAIADVYDALVSKRVYKESMSFEEADSIIMDGMGRHFDGNLKEYYIQARPKLEEFYKSVGEGK